MTNQEENTIADFRLTIENDKLQDVEKNYNVEKRFTNLADFKKLKIESNKKKLAARQLASKNTSQLNTRRGSSQKYSFDQNSHKDDSFQKFSKGHIGSNGKLLRKNTTVENDSSIRNAILPLSNERVSFLGNRITEDMNLLSNLQRESRLINPPRQDKNPPKKRPKSIEYQVRPSSPRHNSVVKPKRTFSYYQERFYYLSALFLGKFDLITSKELKIKIVKDKLNCEKKLSEFEKIESEQKKFQSLTVIKKNFVFSKLWKDQQQKIRAVSQYGHFSSYSLKSVIIKGGDDLRQELFAMQLIKVFQTIFDRENTGIYLRPYEIIPTSHDAGFLEFLTDTMPISSLKKKFNCELTLEEIYREIFKDRFEFAQKKFVESLAGYSLLSYLLQIKDRHNGNIMITHEGHLVHIDFGFILAMSPGGITFESAPFKLTDVS